MIAVIAFSTWVPIQTKANKERLERILENFPGKTMSNVMSGAGYDDYFYNYTWVYEFYKDGKCRLTEEQVDTWKDLNKEETRNDEWNYEYSVSISLTGKITLEIDQGTDGIVTYPLNVNEEDEPISFGTDPVWE